MSVQLNEIIGNTNQGQHDGEVTLKSELVVLKIRKKHAMQNF